MEIALRETQTRFYALDLKNPPTEFRKDDGFNLLNLRVASAEKDGTLQYIASTYDPYDQVIRDGIYEGGRKIITFCGLLQHDIFPLPDILSKVMRYGQDEMRRAVEIEFAANIHANRTGEFYLLQIRPMVDNKLMLDEDLTAIADADCILRSHNAIGHGIQTDVQDIVYVKTEGWSASMNPAIAAEIETINRSFLDQRRGYVLVGPGRWGSSDPWLGIPVKWPHISAAKVIAEAGLDNYRVDPSQGTHFFQNLTSFGVAYLTINDYIGDGIYRHDLLDKMPATTETEHVRVVHFDQPFTIKVDGMKKEGVVLMPS